MDERSGDRSQWGPWAMALGVGVVGVLAVLSELYRRVRRGREQ